MGFFWCFVLISGFSCRMRCYPKHNKVLLTCDMPALTFVVSFHFSGAEKATLFRSHIMHEATPQPAEN